MRSRVQFSLSLQDKALVLKTQGLLFLQIPSSFENLKNKKPIFPHSGKGFVLLAFSLRITTACCCNSRSRYIKTNDPGANRDFLFAQM